MNLYNLFENATRYTVQEVSFGDRDMVTKVCDLINDGGQLSWTLNPQRLQQKIGDTGKIFALLTQQNEPVGVIGIKEMHLDSYSGGEIGYLYVDPEHRSYQNASQLYNMAVSHAGHYDFIVATTNTSNNTVNTLLGRVRGMKNAFTAKSKFSSNMLNYWVCTTSNGTLSYNEIVSLFKQDAGVLDESTSQRRGFLKKKLNEAFAFVGLDSAPSTFRSQLDRLKSRIPNIKVDTFDRGDIVFSFGRKNSLPSEQNTIYVGNKFYPKDRQMDLLKNVVPTIKTYTSALEIDGDYIAKKKIGQRQAGQTINVEPENAEDYVFQPLLDIKSEYRVVVFYMNGEYGVSGVYKKTGSNMSFQSITSGDVYDTAVELAIKATERLGYGLSGVDIALVENNADKIISETLLGRSVSAVGRLMGRFADSTIGDNEIMVVLECNTMPSMSNPMILTDMLTKAKSMANNQ